MRVTRRWSLVLFSLFVIACGGGGDASDGTGGAPCSDGKDNDGDGMSDFPDDLGCRSEDDDSEDGAAAPQCDDNRDNDGDGKKDYPADPGCFAPQADDESDECPDGPSCSQCANGKDDDQNGATDYPNDTGCESAADHSEFLDNPNACGTGLKIKQLPPSGMDMGQLEMGSQSQVASPCGGGMGAFAVAYVLHLTEPKVIVATTDMPGTATDTVIDVRSQMCAEPTSELACSDNISTTNKASTVTYSLAAGVYYIIVQGKDSSVTGSYQLAVSKFAGEGAACSAQGDCGPGLLCRVPAGQSAMVCAKPVCDDGLDDDSDGKIDYPNDPGCGSAVDDTETDDCPSGPNCPECGNGIDDDSDQTIDYPADNTCKSAGDSSESCITTEGVAQLTGPLTPGDTATASDDIKLSCSSTSSTAGDLHYRVDVPALASLSVGLSEKTSSFWSAAVALLPSSCTGAELACSTSPDPETVTLSNVAAGTYYFVVDGQFASSSGSYKVSVSGKFANGTACENNLGGAFTCNTGYACKGAVGSKTCQPAQCNDGMDNNGNGKTDFPNDAGCETASDDTETTVCPGPMCPVCSNGLDDDMDTFIDFPADTSCKAASGNNEACISSEPVVVLTTPMTTGLTTVGAVNDTKGCASSSTATAPDIHHQLDLPAMQTVSVALVNKSPTSWDSVIGLYNGSCAGTALSCADFSPETVTGTNLAAGRYYVVVDGWSSAQGGYGLNVSGTIANGGSCESALAQSGAITCGAGYACKGATGNKTCQPAQCGDGIDNNSDGKIDFPFDPGCSSTVDDTETTVCPGANCPVCANGMDDDADTKTDFPTDFGCVAAGGTTEVFCTGEPDVAMNPITTPATSGNLMAVADNYDQTCLSTTGNDMAFGLQLPVPVATLVIDTEGSTITDTAISLKDATCGTQLACDDDTGTGNLSKMTVSNVSAGNYAIQVDSYSTTNNGAFTLNVKGTVAPMTSCTSPLFSAGVLVCPAGTTCKGNPLRCAP